MVRTHLGAAKDLTNMQIPIMDTGAFSGWVLEARIHFGHHLTQYVGVSVFVKEFNASLLARTSSLLLCVGFGSYLAYRLCLKIFGCPNLSSLLTRLKSDCLWNTDNDVDLCDNLKPYQVNDAWSSTKSVDDAVSVSDEDSDTESTRLTDISGNEKYFWFNDRHRSNSVEAFLPTNDCFNDNEEEDNRNKHKHFNETKRTRALSDDENFEASTSSGSTHSPPPIRRRTKMQNLDRPTSVPFRDTSASRCSSQAFAWDPVFTPCSMDDTQFRALDEALTNRNLDEFYSPASLIERFLASLDNEAANQQGHLDRQFLSPGPSEMSEFSVAADRELGDQTVDNMERLQGDLIDLKSEVKTFYDDFGKYFDERKQWITGTDYSKEIYRSVVVVPSSSSDTASVISSCKTSPPTVRTSRKRWTTSSLKLPEKKKKTKRVIKPLVQDSGFGAGTSSFYDSYHTQISADMHASQSSGDGCSGSDGKHCGGSGWKPKVSITSSFVDSCISMDFRSISSGSSENILLNPSNFISGHQTLFVPSLGVTPEDRDGEGMSTAGSVRPESLEWDEMDTNTFMDDFTNDSDFSCNRYLPNVDVADNAIDLSRYIRARFPGNEKCLKAARRLAKRRQLCYTKLMDDGHDSLIRACLEGIRINKLPIFKCTTYQTVKEAVDVSLKRCSYLSQFACTSLSSSLSSRTEEIGKNVELLWQFQNDVLENAECVSLLSGRDEAARKLVQGVKVLMMLRVVEVYEQISFTRKPPLPFYNELFRNRTPRCVAKQLSQCGTLRNLKELEMALLADTLGFVLELYKFDSTTPANPATYPEQITTAVVPSAMMNRVAVGLFGARNFMPLL